MRKTPLGFCLILVAAALGAAGVLTGCAEKEPPPPPAVRVENPAVGVAIAALGSGFVVTSDDGASIELVPAREGATGTVSVVAGEAEIGGINLVAAVKAHQEEILERPDGDYKGQTEFVTPLGTTYASRGRYSGDGGTVEEVLVLMVHPWGDRVLKVVYLYPAAGADDTKARLDALMNGVVGELEGLPPPSAAEGGGPDGS